MTWYQGEEQLADFLDYDIIKNNLTYMYFDGKPLYPFGHGLTFSEFTYTSMLVDQHSYQSHDTINIEVVVTNTGNVVSDEVVQLYVSGQLSRVKIPIKQLKGFKRISLEPEQSMKVSFLVPVSELAIWDVTRDRFCVESGAYKLMIGSSSEDIRMESMIQVMGERIPHRDLTKLTYAENYDDYEAVILDECLEGRTGVKAVNNQGWIAFHDVEFKKIVNSLELRISGGIEGGNIEVRLDHPDGLRVGNCKIMASEHGEWSTVTCDVDRIEGNHAVFLILQGTVSVSHFTFTDTNVQ